ncbi:hypothetical protein [Actinoalloteichus hymeniacidonis]|uniref:Uncharacterized protein n=1 Tax=Actinoalloteichus hymeniacidonis TaxID=340345 RepID=A0AAC9MX77_9PSEU|nr:hypothetical protein [Actinoalloteichus hymeniacidonis]AOS61979.1 hypothetical protein TL08_05770 [Actinoalloteichus hymeniacidonis]MBB5909999.1 hypothetical protein [Actinoalloteichus hymeniacidonis]
MRLDIAILAGWQEDPFYYDAGDGDYNHSIEEAAAFLGLGVALTRDIATWDAEFQAIYSPADTRTSAFATPEQESRWLETGRKLAQRIKQESAIAASVNYRGDGTIPDQTCVF